MENKRTYWIDSLKFLSMIMVFLCHMRLAFFPTYDAVIKIGNINIPNYLFNGNIAVCMFLVISVFLYAKKGQRKQYDRAEMFSEVSKRYIRLLIPALFVNCVILICFLLGLFYNLEMENFSEYSIYWFNFGSPLKALAKTFLGSISLCFFENGINPPLWCYHFFFLFPILMLVITQVIDINDIKVERIAYFILILCFIFNSYFAVIPGTILLVSYEKKSKRGNIIFSLIGIMLIVMIQYLLLNRFNGIKDRINVSLNFILVFAIFDLFNSLQERSLLNNKIFSYCNNISFGIYLLHMPVICSLGYFVLQLTNNFAITCSLIISSLIFLSVFYYIFIEKKLVNWVIRKI